MCASRCAAIYVIENTGLIRKCPGLPKILREAVEDIRNLIMWQLVILRAFARSGTDGVCAEMHSSRCAFLHGPGIMHENVSRYYSDARRGEGMRDGKLRKSSEIGLIAEDAEFPFIIAR